MKRNVFYGLLAMVLAIGMVACSNGTTGGGGDNTGGNNNGGDNKKRLYNYLLGQYGKTIISGQMDTTWNTDMDMIARVYNDTGKYPAIKGFDLMLIHESYYNYGKQQIDEAIEWWEGKNNGEKLLSNNPNIHGIVAFCWHWRAGSSLEFRTDQTDFRIPWKNNTLDTSSPAFQTIKSDLDKAAALLQQLKDKGIPVLWRPLHEASGNWGVYAGEVGWFWWGASGPAPYIALWEYMYDYFTNTKKLDNLIWVWNGQNEAWFPNPATVDIVGWDYYPWPRNTPQTAHDYNSQKALFDRTAQMVSDGTARIVAMTENGGMPDPDKCKQDNAMWSWFMTWNDMDNPAEPEGQHWSTEFVNTNAHKNHVYKHSLVITLDELPDLTTYPLETSTTLDPPNNDRTVTISPNDPYGYQTLLAMSELAGTDIQVASGTSYTLTYTFTSNVSISDLQVFLVDNSEAANWWKELSGRVSIGAVSAGTPVSGTKTIAATGAASGSSDAANKIGLSIGVGGAASTPTLTFTTLTLAKN